MADNQKYYYMRLKEDFFNDDAIQILEAMPDGYLYCNILLKLYLKSLKNDGRLMYNERIPYNATVLSTITRHSVGVIEKALEIFESMGLIEVLDNGAIYMLDIQNYIGKTTTEADRKREYRNRIANEKQQLIGQMSGQMSDKSTPEIEKDIEQEIEIEIDKKERVDYQRVAAMYNDTCVSYPRLKTLSDARKKAIKARLKTYTYEDLQTVFTKAEASDFLKGKNDRNWSATFDWLMKDTSIAKVLDGNYDNKPQAAKPKNSFNAPKGRNYEMDALERMMLSAQNQPKTAGNDAGVRAKAEQLQRELAQRELA